MTEAESSLGGPETATDRAPTADRTCFLTLVAATFVFLAVAGYPRQWSLGLLINDEFWYAHLARSLYEGAGYVTRAMYPMQAPNFDSFPVPEQMKQSGYSLVSALVWQLTGVSERALLVVANAGLSLFAGLVFLLSRQLGWGWKSSMFASAATVANPLVAQYGVQALPESLYFACFTLVFIAVLRGGFAAVVCAGVANAVLIIVKGHGIIYVPVFLGYLWMHGATSLRQSIRPTRRKLHTAATYLGVLLGTLVAATILLPDGSVQIFEASASYSHGLLIETGRTTSALAYLETQPTDPWAYILEHPGQYLDKVARQIRRTKVIIDDLGGPAFGGILFPSLMLCGFLLLASVFKPGSFLPITSENRDDIDPYLLFAAVIGITFLFFWPIHLVTRFVTHILPLMLLLCMYVLGILATLFAGTRPALKRTLLTSAILYFVAYPATVTIWDSYRQPLKHVGSKLAVRFLDFERMRENVTTMLPEDPVVVSEMAHEITWFAGARTILFPNFEDDLRYLVQRYDVDALYEHPLFPRDWPWIRREFVLADDANGFLWVRRRERE